MCLSKGWGLNLFKVSTTEQLKIFELKDHSDMEKYVFLDASVISCNAKLQQSVMVIHQQLILAINSDC